VSRGILLANARRARAEDIRLYAPSILDADAWGHGEELVAAVLVEAGLAPDPADSADAAAGDVAVPGARRSLSAPRLFGLPGSDGTPALRLTGTVLSVKDLRRGEGVSYGYAYRAPVDTRVALVTGGYAQGIVRALGGSADVMIAGMRHPIVGRVAMDVCVVEIGNSQVERGDEALFLGDASKGEPSLADWLAPTGLSAGELITMVGLRALREVVA
jgi:alanine racemase